MVVSARQPTRENDMDDRLIWGRLWCFIQDMQSEGLIDEELEERLSDRIEAMDPSDPMMAAFMRSGCNGYIFLDMMQPVIAGFGSSLVRGDAALTSPLPAATGGESGDEGTETSSTQNSSSTPRTERSAPGPAGFFDGASSGRHDSDLIPAAKPAPTLPNGIVEGCGWGGGDAAKPFQGSLGEGSGCGGGDSAKPGNVRYRDGLGRAAGGGGSPPHGAAEGCTVNPRRRTSSHEWMARSSPPGMQRKPNILEPAPRPRIDWLEHNTRSVCTENKGGAVEVTMSAVLTIWDSPQQSPESLAEAIPYMAMVPPHPSPKKEDLSSPKPAPPTPPPRVPPRNRQDPPARARLMFLNDPRDSAGPTPEAGVAALRLDDVNFSTAALGWPTPSSPPQHSPASHFRA